MVRRPDAEPGDDPYRRLWESLTPAERLRRSWRLRRRVRNLQRVHDEKLLSVFDPPAR